MRSKLKNADVHNHYRQVTTCTGYTLKDEFSGIYINSLQMLTTLALAIVILAVTFLISPINFWFSIAVSNLILAFAAVFLGGYSVNKRNFDMEAFIVGIIMTLVLFGITVLGKVLLDFIIPVLPFLGRSLDAIYALKEQVPIYLIIFVLIFITSPCEEIFWRGFIQRGLIQSFGLTKGWILGALIYSAVHIVSLNLLLVLAAFVCGLVWGYIYMRQRHIASCIVSHALWAVIVFVLFPLA